MIHRKLETDNPKGWFAGPWNSAVPIPIGYANEGIKERHYHAEMFEIYLVAKGSSVAIVGDAEVQLEVGDMLVVEPGEVHTFMQSSDDYLHFVVQTPFVKGDKFVAECIGEAT